MSAAPPPDDVLRALAATWPAAATRRAGPFLLHEGRGGGRRVSAAQAQGPWVPADVEAAIAGMEALGQAPLFRLAPQEKALAARLAGRGLVPAEVVLALAAPLPLGPVAGAGAVTAHWPPLPAQRALWEAGGTGVARQRVMARVAGPRAALALGDAGVAFVACAGNVAAVHALLVAPARRREGIGRRLMAGAALWAGQQGAGALAVAVVATNAAALVLHSGLGLRECARWQYHLLPGDADA